MNAMPESRTLELAGIASIMAEVERLTARHVTVGHWTLAQICDHLTRSINLSLDLPPATEPPTREQAVYRRLFFRSRSFPEGQDLAHPSQEPPAGVEPGESVAALRAAVERLETHDGPFAAHPVLGPMSREEWLLFHTRHAAHHLGFVVG